MNVSGTGSMEQMRMMNGSGGGQGQGGGMKEIMKNMSAEDQAAMKDSLSGMNQNERMAAVTQMKEVDASTMSEEEYTQTLLDILDQDTTNKSQTDSFSVYA